MRHWVTEFDEEGFVVLRGVIDKERIATAKALADRLWNDLADNEANTSSERMRVLKRDLPGGAVFLTRFKEDIRFILNCKP